VTKSKEIIINLQKTHVPVATYLTRVESLKLLGITFNNKLCFEPHISYICIQTALCSSKTLRAHGLTGRSLWDVTQATLIARIMYAAPAWWGFLSVAQDRTESDVKKPSTTATYQAILSKYILWWNVWNQNYSTVFCPIPIMYCITYHLL